MSDGPGAGLLLEVPMFSKFLHGAAVLYPDRCREVPYWFLPDEGATLPPATYEEMADTADVYLKVRAANSRCLQDVNDTALDYQCYPQVILFLDQEVRHLSG